MIFVMMQESLKRVIAVIALAGTDSRLKDYE
jgi:hypothetical protein